jgi:hypothetical protein
LAGFGTGAGAGSAAGTAGSTAAGGAVPGAVQPETIAAASPIAVMAPKFVFIINPLGESIESHRF